MANEQGRNAARLRVSIGPGVVDSNKGDQALVSESVRLARQIYPDAEIRLISNLAAGLESEDGETRHTRRLGVEALAPLLPSPRRGSLNRAGAVDTRWHTVRMGLTALFDAAWSLVFLVVCKYPRLANMMLGADKRKTCAFLRSSEVLIVKGGGFIYGYKGLRYYYFLYYQLYLFMAAMRMGVPVVILPNSFGPFYTGFSKWLTRRVLNRCKLVAAREKISYEWLEKIGVDMGPVSLMPDLAFMLEPGSAEDAERRLEAVGVDLARPKLGVTLRPWRFPGHDDPQAAWRNYLGAVTEALNHALSKGWQIVFLPQSLGPHDHEDDRIAIRQVMERLPAEQRKFADGDWLPADLAAMYGQMDLMLGTRMHSVIFGLVSGVPALAISYQGPKATGIMQAVGLGDFVVPIEQTRGEKLIELFDRLADEREARSRQIIEHVTRFRAELTAWWETMDPAR